MNEKNKKEKDQFFFEQLSKRNNEVLGDVYEHYRDWFVKWLTGKYHIEKDIALDIYQDAIIALYENALKGKLKAKSSLKTYLYTLGRNLLINRLKKEQRIIYTENRPENATQIENLELFSEPTPKQKQVAKLLLQLGEPCKTILELYYYYNWDLKDIALRMEYNNANVVKTQKARCVKRFKTMMGKM